MHYKNAAGLLLSDNRMNLYRGCSHGCIYCDSRSECYRMDHPFEDIEVKINAPELLKKALKCKRRKCIVTTGSMCDPYMPAEDRLKLTRQCAEIIYSHGFGFSFITKSDMFLRDIDLLKSINDRAKCVVQMTITTSDDDLCRIIEPGVCVTSRRVDAMIKLKEEGIPAVVWLSPVLPFITDTEDNIRRILELCFLANVKGIICFDMGVTLRRGNREYFYHALDQNFPGLRKRYEKTYGNSYICQSPNHRRLMDIFNFECEKAGVLHTPGEVFQYIEEFPNESHYTQLSFI